MSTLQSTDRDRLPLGKRGAFEGVARWHGCQRNPARTTSRSQLRTPTNPPRHHAQRWVEKVGRSIKGSDTPQPPEPRPINGSLSKPPYHPHIQHTDLGTTSTYLQGIDPSEFLNAIYNRRQPTIPANAGLSL
jgi:hypothetical protein